MKKIKYICIIALIIVIIMLLANRREIITIIRTNQLQAETEPIDMQTGLINNEYFGISSDGSNVEETTDGINKAIEYAYQNNIEYIKLKKGKYLVGNIKSDTIVARAIMMKSNINLDLNGSTIQFIENAKPVYAVISLMGVDDISIKNGILVGDKNEHDYNSYTSTHEWGNGIDIRGASNIQIENVQISDMTGDGIFICDYKQNNATNIDIKNCNIYDNRRQGISVTSCENVNIHNNEIHNISGTWPQSGIDLEADDENHLIKDVKIFNNKFYDFYSRYAIICSKMVENVDIYENEINARIYIMDIKQKCNIYNNVIINGQVWANDISGKEVRKVSLKDNYLINSTIKFNSVDKVLIEGNKIENGNILIESSDAGIYNNSITNTDKFDYVINILTQKENKYYIYYSKNVVNGEYTDEITVQNKDKIILNNIEDDVKIYIHENFGI